MVNLFLCLSLVLKSSESLPKYDKMKGISLLETMKIRSFLMNNLIKKPFNTLIHEVLGIISVLEY